MLTYRDSSALLAAWRGPAPRQIRALTIIKERGRVFACSPYVQLELMPKAVYHKNYTEIAFYEAYFAAVSYWESDGNLLLQKGDEIARRYGLAALDALHVAAAWHLGAQEFITAERATSPFSRVRDIRVVSIN